MLISYNLKGRTRRMAVENRNNQLFFSFNYDPVLLADFKASFEKRKWHPDDKMWSAPLTPHNVATLKYLAGDPIFQRYAGECPMLEHFHYPLFDHQKLLASHIYYRQQVIIAAEMGTGKSLAVIEAVEHIEPLVYWWIGPPSGNRSVQLEMEKWGTAIVPRFITYDSLDTYLRKYSGAAPDVVVFDESTKIKTPGTKRSKAAEYLVTEVRKEHENPYIVLMSGSPAPNRPTDWFHQARVACPGYLKEGSIHDLETRLAVLEEQDFGAGPFKKIVTWRNDPSKCDVCGQPQDDPCHTSQLNNDFHRYAKSINEVEKLGKRLQGLTVVVRADECLDLPELRYEPVDIEVPEEYARAAKMIARTAGSTMDCLLRLRMLSDGFRYENVPTGNKLPCPVCDGSGESLAYYKNGEPVMGDEDFDETRSETCHNCVEGVVDEIRRDTIEIGTPKDPVFLEDLATNREVGRFVTYGGFQGTIKRLVRLASEANWHTIQWDGTTQGKPIFRKPDGEVITGVDPLISFQDGNKDTPICFCAHAGSASTGLTLTAARTLAFFSSTYNADERMQAEKRIHRAGMENRAAIVRDYLLFDTDRLVLDALQNKTNLQNMSLTAIRQALGVTPDDEV